MKHSVPLMWKTTKAMKESRDAQDKTDEKNLHLRGSRFGDGWKTELARGKKKKPKVTLPTIKFGGADV